MCASKICCQVSVFLISGNQKRWDTSSILSGLSLLFFPQWGASWEWWFLLWLQSQWWETLRDDLWFYKVLSLFCLLYKSHLILILVSGCMSSPFFQLPVLLVDFLWETPVRALLYSAMLNLSILLLCIYFNNFYCHQYKIGNQVLKMGKTLYFGNF